jgi:hypothetical protein
MMTEKERKVFSEHDERTWALAAEIWKVVPSMP